MFLREMITILIARIYFLMRKIRRDQQEKPLDDWLKAERDMSIISFYVKNIFVVVVFVAVALLYVKFNSDIRLRLVLGVALLGGVAWVIICKQKILNIFEFALVLMLVGFVLLGFNNIVTAKNEMLKWNNIFKTKVENAPVIAISITLKGMSIVLEGSKGEPAKLNAVNPLVSQFSGSIERSIVSSLERQMATKNLICNGDFDIPLSNNLSKWGSGKYSDQYRKELSGIRFAWVNALNAQVDISVVVTEIGNALKITNSSGKRTNVVGFMEQMISPAKGKYKLSFLAKAEDNLESGALQINTTPDWNVGKGGVEVNMQGPFDWKMFENNIEVDGPDVTVTIVSVGKGTVFIRDVSLVRIDE